MFYQIGKDPLQGGGRNSKADAGTFSAARKNGCIDSDHFARSVQQMASAVTGIDCCIGLYQIIHKPSSSLQASSERGNDTGSEGTLQTKRVSNGKDLLPHFELFVGCQLDGSAFSCRTVDLEEGDIIDGIHAHHLSIGL